MTRPETDVAGVSPLDQRRVSVVCRATRVDVSLPAHLELVAIIPEIVELIRDHIRSVTGPGTLVDLDAEMGAAGSGSWQLTRLGGDPLSVSESLARQKVVNGEILVLDRRLVPSPAPLIDDVLDGVAATGGAATEWTDRDTSHTAHIAVWTLGAVLSVALITALGIAPGPSSGTASDTGPGPMPALLAGGLAAAALLALAVGRIVTARTPTVLTAGLATTWFAGLAAAAATTGAPAAEHEMAGCAVSSVIAGILFVTSDVDSPSAVTERSVYLCASVIGWAGAVSAGVMWWFGFPLHAVGAGASLAGLAGLTLAPPLSVSLGRIPLPPVPGPTDDLTGELTDVDPGGLPDPHELALRARSARGLLGGLVAGCGTVVVTGALLALSGTEGAPLLASAMAVALVGVLVLRGITTSDRTHTVIQLALALSLVLGMLTGAVLFARDPLGGVALGALAVATVTVVASIVLPRIELSPLVRGSLGIVEALLMSAVVPLALGIMGVYQLIRQL